MTPHFPCYTESTMTLRVPSLVVDMFGMLVLRNESVRKARSVTFSFAFRLEHPKLATT